jgi:predicted acyltransferase
MTSAKIQSDAATKTPPGSGRLMSLDVFRGATIAAMMLVNNPGTWSAVYPQLDHAEWNGWTFTDVIFPFFLWIVGVVIPLSTVKRRQRGESNGTLFWHVLRRAVIIFLLGLSLDLLWHILDGSYAKAGGMDAWLAGVGGTIRIMGVLQRIAICYLIASAIYLLTGWRAQIGWVIGLLAGYWLLMKFAPVPGHEAWTFAKERNFSAYVDQHILGRHTLHGMPWDPEGIISTIPAIATCLFGVLTGQLLLVKRSMEQKTAWLFVSGNFLMLLGAILNIWLPINKNLWTSAYSVFMAGLAMNVFAVCYWLVDVKGYQKWAKPFAIYGMNAITVFMLSGIIGRILLAKKVKDASGDQISLEKYLFQSGFNGPLSRMGLGPKICSLSWAVMCVTALFLMTYVMYRRKWIVKL